MQLLLSTAYWPPVSWLGLAIQAEHFLLEACEHYQKGSWRNRCHLVGASGIHRLSIPLLQGKHQQTPIRDVRIAYSEPWQRNHWSSIQTHYGRAPFFEHYGPEVARFYTRKWTFLFDLNLACVEWLLGSFRTGGSVHLTTRYEPRPDADIRDLRTALAPGGHPAQVPRYGQVFEDRLGFIPDASALDLLFCQGKQGKSLLEKTSVVS